MVKTMKIKNEHLSAVFDDEAGAFEQRRLLDELEKDEELKQSWSNYALIGDVMREPAKASVADPEFLSSMQLRLEEEDAYSHVIVKTSQKKKASWLQPASGIAIAATVAAISVFSMQTYMNTGNEQDSNLQVAQAPLSDDTAAPVITKAVVTQFVPVAATTPIVTDTVVASTTIKQQPISNAALDERTKMQRYLASHIRNASRKTIAPTLRMISYNYH